MSADGDVGGKNILGVVVHFYVHIANSVFLKTKVVERKVCHKIGLFQHIPYLNFSIQCSIDRKRILQGERSEGSYLKVAKINSQRAAVRFIDAVNNQMLIAFTKVKIFCIYMG